MAGISKMHFISYAWLLAVLLTVSSCTEQASAPISSSPTVTEETPLDDQPKIWTNHPASSVQEATTH